MRSRLGEDHPDTLSSMNNLFNVLKEQGKWQEAEQLHREALKGMRPRLGEDHPDTLSSMNNLANVLQEQGKRQEAEQLHREALKVRRSRLGDDHPDTLSSVNNLANIEKEYGRKGTRLVHNDLSEASLQSYATDSEVQQRQALQGLEAKLGAGHPDALRARLALADLLAERGRLSEAAAELRRDSELSTVRTASGLVRWLESWSSWKTSSTFLSSNGI